MSHKELLNPYKAYLLSLNYSPRSVERYEGDLRDFFGFLREKKIGKIQEVRREDLRDYSHKVVTSKRKSDNQPLSQWTKSGRVAALKTFFRYLLKKGILLYNPASEIDLPKVYTKKVREVLKERELFKILDSIGSDTPLDLRDRAMFELFYSSGIRNSELRFLKVEDIDLGHNEVRILHGKGRFGKRQRILPLGRTAQSCLEAYLRHGRARLLKGKDPGFLFLSKEGAQTSILLPSRRFKLHAKGAGIKKHVFPHILRHSFATHLLRHGADIRYVQEMLGHESLDSTKIYTKVEISDLKRIHRRTHPRERNP